jgi:predicted amidohydrolase YtcJ
MNPKMPSAQAIAVKGSRISHVGTNQMVQEFIGENTKTIQLEGKTVLPGFIDTHTHIADFGKLLTWMDLENAASIKDVQTQLAERIKQTEKGRFVLGKALNPDGLEEKRLPTRKDLDAVAPDNPVVFYCQTGQVCAVNSKALEAAKINGQTEVFCVEKDANGEPNGILREYATNLVWNVIPEPTQQELYQATKLALEKIVQAGVTSVHWIVLSETELPIIQQLIQEDSLPVRVYLIVPSKMLDLALKSLKPLENEHFKLGASIIFSDGYLASRTAALIQPYSDSPDEPGKMLCQPNEMLQLADKIQAAGLQLIIHAVGDKAVTEALNVIQQTSQNPSLAPPRIEQAAVLNQQLVYRIKQLGASVSVQPCVVASEFSVWSAEEHLGEKRVRWLFPVKDLLGCGVVVAAGSDCPMEPLNPLLGVEAAVKRDGPQKVSVSEAIEMYTVLAAKSSNELSDKGSIEQGKLADLTVLSNNPEIASSNGISKISVCFSIIGGNVVCSKT